MNFGFTKYGLVAGLAAASAGLGAVAASAQPVYSSGPTETVIVTAPRMHIDSTPLNGPPERVSLSIPVRYDDLDLLSHSGARELRARLWRTAHEVCDRLADAYPVYQLSTDRPCVRTAYENAMVQAYGAINNVRVNYWSPD
ncbi:MAG TPA: UrcA family protein [Rhizomicrobium sp.]|jgi:UrcA family protein|nr:UrcA family protein [Rhizomicrobium sp.]